MPHGHLFEVPEFFGCMDQYILGAKSMPVVKRPTVRDKRIRAAIQSSTGLFAAHLHYTIKPHVENDRAGTTIEIQTDGDTLSGAPPPSEATAWYVVVRGERDLLVSSEVIVRSVP